MLSGEKLVGDRIFDGLAERFLKNVYGTEKGDIRLSILWEDMLSQIPSLTQGSALSVLDIGGGAGQVAARIANLGHQVVLAEPSKDMLEHAARLIATQDLGAGSIVFENHSIQSMVETDDRQFDLVVFHAVLEWLEDPFACLNLVLTKLKPGGVLSLMFYNKHSIIFKNITKGNFFMVLKEQFRGHSGGLTPINPLDPEAVYCALEQQNMHILGKAGIRCFYDHMRKDAREKRTLEQIIAMEQRFCRQQPYLGLARYIHVVAVKQVNEMPQGTGV